MMPYWEPSSSTYNRKRVAELFPQHLAPRPSFFFRLTHPNAEKFHESQLLPALPPYIEFQRRDLGRVRTNPIMPHMNEVMPMILVHPTHPIQPASHTHALPIPLPMQPNKFEIGTTSAAVLTRAQRRNYRRNKNRRIKKSMWREKQEKEDEVMRETSPLLDSGRFQALSATDVLTNTPRRKRNRRVKKVMSGEKQEKEDKVMCEASPLRDGGRFHALSAADVLANTQRCNMNRSIMKMMPREKQEKEDKVMCEASPLLDGGRVHALSTTAVLNPNTQRRNKNRRIKKRMSKAKQEKEDKVMCETSPPLHGGISHVLPATKGEEDVNKIVVSPEERAGKCEQHLGDVVLRTAETSIITKEEVIARTKGIVSQSLVASLMEEEDKTLAGNTLVVQPSSQNMQGFAGQSIVSTIVEGHDTESQHRLTASAEILSVDATISSPESPTSPKSSHQARQMVSKPSNLKTTNSEVPTISPSTSVNHADSNCEEKEPTKASSYHEEAPFLVNHGQPLSWKSIEELMQDLRENLRKMDEDLCGVSTGSSSLLGDCYADELLEDEVEEGESIVLIQ